MEIDAVKLGQRALELDDQPLGTLPDVPAGRGLMRNSGEDLRRPQCLTAVDLKRRKLDEYLEHDRQHPSLVRGAKRVDQEHFGVVQIPGASLNQAQVEQRRRHAPFILAVAAQCQCAAMMGASGGEVAAGEREDAEVMSGEREPA